MVTAISKLVTQLLLAVFLFCPPVFAQEAVLTDSPVVVDENLEPGPEIYTDVQDRTRGIRDQERNAYFQVLEHAEQGDNNRQREVARKNLAELEKLFYTAQQEAKLKKPGQPHYRYSLYADLLNNPDAYRGKLVTLRGHIRRLEEMPLRDGERDLGQAYQAYLFTEDSRTHPYIIVCRFVPPEMPHGGDISEEVEVTGYFFKLYAYDAQDTARVAPLILAQRLNWFPQQETQPLISPMLGGLLAALALLVLVIFLWRIAVKDRRVREAQLRKIAEETEPFSSSEL